MSTHLVQRLRIASVEIKAPQWGEWDSKSLLDEAADEIDRLRRYAILLESINPASPKINQARQDTQVNWEAIHGVNP